MALADSLRAAGALRGWDWSRMRTRMDPLGWSYTDVLLEHLRPGTRALDIGTGGGEVFSSVARAADIALDVAAEMLAVARETLPCRLVVGDQRTLPIRDSCVDVVADRHVGADPREVFRVLRPNGVYVTQQVGGRICQSIFDAFAWGSNGEFWRREHEMSGRPFWNVDAMATWYAEAGCVVVMREEADVDYEFLDHDSMAFWLSNAPLPERVDPERHAGILGKLSLKTNWHSELLVVRR